MTIDMTIKGLTPDEAAKVTAMLKRLRKGGPALRDGDDPPPDNGPGGPEDPPN